MLIQYVKADFLQERAQHHADDAWILAVNNDAKIYMRCI